jgi:hypothetical protein
MRGVTLFLVALLLQGIGAQAANLDKDACVRLEEEQGKFEKAGVRATIAKGAAWAKDNLSPDKMQEVRRLIEVDEQILFRCQGKPLVLLPSSVDADPVVTTTDENAPDGEKPADGKVAPAKAVAPKDAPAKAAPKAAAAKSDTAPVKKAAPVAPKATTPTQPKPQSKDGAAKSSEAAVAKPKPAPKKKVDDAYKPPQPDAGQSPFGFQTPKQ